MGRVHHRIGGAPGLVLLALALLAGAQASAQAGSLEVSPVLIEMVAPAMSSVMTVANRGGHAVSVQVRAFAWTQGATDDILAPTRALLVSPPIVEIAAGATQTVRLLLREPATAQDTAYRLLIDELPAAADTSAVRMSLRISLPVFAKPALRTAPDLQWHIQSGGRDGSRIVALNRGTAAERVADLAVQGDRAGLVKAVTLVNPWVLPGTERHWTVVLPQPVERRSRPQMHLTALLRAGPVDVAAPITP